VTLTISAVADIDGLNKSESMAIRMRRIEFLLAAAATLRK
jgi:hypothetical protein